MSRYRGREVDDIGLWSKYIEVPQGAEKETHYWPLTVCPNPEHDTLKKHFQVNVQDGLVHCFARCGISGTYEHAIQLIEGCRDREARKIILEFARGTKRKTTSLRNRGSDRAPIPKPNLEYDSFIPQIGMEYLEKRGIEPSSIARFGLGWYPEEKRLVIPARDLQGQTRFLIRRAVMDRQHPKYLYTEGFAKSSLLFGACATDLGLIRSDGLILVEGSIDAIRVSQHGMSNVVATLGTGISSTQVEIVSRLRPRKIFCFFDKDSAGVASIEIVQRRLRGRYPLFVVQYPKAKADPAECSREEVERAIARAIPIRNFTRKVKQLKVRR